MTVGLTVVPIREGPSLAEVPAQLRALADRIEAGEYGEVDGLFALMPRPRDYPITFGWGVTSGAFDAIIQFELARQWHVRAGAGMVAL